MDIATRTDLVRFVASLGATDAVEIGVHKGAFSSVILQDTMIARLWLVDPWETFRRMNGDKTYAFCRQALGRFGGRARFIRRRSLDAAPLFVRDRFDFVYIDADHSREAVAADLRAWWPLCRTGGVFAGHDYCRRQKTYGVIDAVDEFFCAMDRTVSVTTDDGHWPTWWVVK